MRALEVGGVGFAAKLEALQRSGSLKIRGAANQMLPLTRPAAVSTASGGPAVAVVGGGNVDADTVQRAREILTRMRLPEPRPEAHSLHH